MVRAQSVPYQVVRSAYREKAELVFLRNSRRTEAVNTSEAKRTMFRSVDCADDARAW